MRYSAGAATPFSFSFPFGHPPKLEHFHERDHETDLTKKQAGSFLDGPRRELASGHGGEVFKKNG
jgi:hypothetical protein